MSNCLVVLSSPKLSTGGSNQGEVKSLLPENIICWHGFQLFLFVNNKFFQFWDTLVIIIGIDEWLKNQCDRPTQ